MYIDGINHLTLRVSNLEISDHFYRQVLGLTRVGQRPGMHFYTSGRFTHELALLHDRGYRNNGRSGMAHVCFNVSTRENLRTLHQRCRHFGFAPSKGVDHTIMHAFYLPDPDGHVIEIGLDIPESAWRHVAEPFARDHALEL
jgi:catechol 2,3-dioxygenase